MYKYAGIIVNNDSISLDRIFTYSIPQGLIGKVDVGMMVKVPFGRANKKLDGFIMKLYEKYEKVYRIKDIEENSDYKILLSKQDIELILKMKEIYLCTYLECIKCIIPIGITRGAKSKTSELIFPGEELKDKYLKEPYVTIYKLINMNSGIYTKGQLSKNFNISLSSINTMIKYGFLIQNNMVINRYDLTEYDAYEKRILNIEQRLAVERILNSNIKEFLIHGITGSGKTEIYMNLVEHMINVGKQSIVLVPEISLTPQMIERFKGRFGRNIAVFHSRLSDGERFDEWFRVKNRETNVAIGARSAVFLPFDNLGLIIIDEEHEYSYKSDSDPKYNAKEIARLKSQIENCKVVLGSATPSIETYNKCINKEIDLIEIKNRVDGALMPIIEAVDMREELSNGNRSIFSKKLYEEITECLNNKEQVILFINRRGFSTFVSCRKCGYVFKCNNCDVSLTYHNNENILTCHYCGKKEVVSKTCPKCGSSYVKYFGVGTEKVEEQINKYFPKAKTLRMDFDTTRKKGSHEYIYRTFKEGKADILIGTQMIAKGLDFKNVTLVGIVAADLSLNLPDYRSSEKTFQLITQVSGRSGRGKKNGKVIIQTYNPEEYSIKYALTNDYHGFFNHELAIREMMNYPPFSKILLVSLSSENEGLLIKSIQNLGVIIRGILKNSSTIQVLGPCPSAISKIKNSYRWQLIIKGDITSTIAELIKSETYTTLKAVYLDIRISMDINPNSLI